MKKSKWLAITGLTVVSTLILAACGNSNASNTYSYVYSNDPDTLDYVNSNRATTSDVIANLVDGLLENDEYGNLVPSIAEDWTVSKDGLTYTYKLRKDAKWYTSDGEEYAEVKAQDFVTGLKHAADEKSEALPIVQSSIKGLDAYVKGESNDFSTVGVKAVDDYTVEYTLNQPESYWNSKTTMGILFPINEDFLKSQGKDFGTVKPSSILYNGPYVLKAFTSKSVIEYAKNQNYWDKDNVKVENIKLTYFDGSDQESLIRNFSDGAYSQARLYPTSSNYASVEKQYKDNIIYTPQNSTSFYFAFNLNRKAYNHSSKTTDAQKTSTTAAIQNKDFRQAINFAFDRTSFGAQMNGKDGATKLIRSLLVPPSFVQVDGKDFSDVVESKLPTYKTASTMLTRPRQSLLRLRKPCKQKVLNSRFISIFLWTRLTKSWYSGPTLSNSLLKQHSGRTMSSLMFSKCLQMTLITLPTLQKQQLRRTTISTCLVGQQTTKIHQLI